MSNGLFIYPYNEGSNSVKALKEGLGAKIIKLEKSKFKGSKDKIVINWGNSTENTEVSEANVINSPDAVKLATNKRTFFEAVIGQLNIPEFTTSREAAEAWIRDGKIVVVREKLTGHSGEGIVLLANLSEWQSYAHENAKLYVLYIPKLQEYRVHVMGGEVIDLQRKAIAPGLDKNIVNFRVRNHDNGFIFVRNNEQEKCPPQVTEQAILAIRLTGLDFGAVDVIWNQHRNQAYVLEINTAPGLEGQTITTYIESLDRIYIQGMYGREPRSAKIRLNSVDLEAISRERVLQAQNALEREFREISTRARFGPAWRMAPDGSGNIVMTNETISATNLEAG